MSRDYLFEALEKLDIKNDDTILIHSSYKSLGKIPFNAKDLLSFIIDYLNKGTLLLPSLSYKYVNNNNPCFDVNKTKSCVGYLSETFRTNFNVKRSIHPTHSVCAIGKYAIEITKNHELDNTPCGKNSPFSLLPNYKGKILMLGCGLKPNTIMHAIEENFIPDYLFGSKLNYTIINNKGINYNKDYYTHNFSGFNQKYERIIDSNHDLWIKKGTIFEAECFVLDAINIWKNATELLRKDIYYFVEPKVN